MNLVRAALIALLAVLAVASPAVAQVAPTRLVLTFSWDAAPHNVSTARNLQSLYGLYGWGVDTLFDKADLQKDKKGMVARIVRVPLDAYVAWLVTVTGHEFGHCQQAWLGGSEDCRWISAPGPYALGHVISIGDFDRLSPAERQASTAGGTQASVVGADMMKRDMFLAGEAHWTTSPLLVFRQLDLPLYGLTSPSPSEAEPADYANDMTNYALRYGARSGQGGEAVHRTIVHGSVWSLADPMTWIGGYNHVAGYIVRGDRTVQVPGLRFGGRTWMVTTSAWLSEVGVRKSLGVLSRGGTGDLLEVTPSWGESQPSVSARWSHAVRPGLRASVSGDLWRQRAAAAPGPLETGGSFGGGLSVPVGRFMIFGDAGYKSRGVMLAQPHAAGWFWSIGGGVRVGPAPPSAR